MGSVHDNSGLALGRLVLRNCHVRVHLLLQSEQQETHLHPGWEKHRVKSWGRKTAEYLGILVVIPPALDTHAQPKGHVADALHCTHAQHLNNNCLRVEPASKACSASTTTPHLRHTLLQISLFSLTSSRTSEVFIIFCANFLTSFTAFGAFFLKVTLCRRLCRLIVYSRVTTSLLARFPFLPSTICTFHGNHGQPGCLPRHCQTKFCLFATLEGAAAGCYAAVVQAYSHKLL